MTKYSIFLFSLYARSSSSRTSTWTALSYNIPRRTHLRTILYIMTINTTRHPHSHRVWSKNLAFFSPPHPRVPLRLLLYIVKLPRRSPRLRKRSSNPSHHHLSKPFDAVVWSHDTSSAIETDRVRPDPRYSVSTSSAAWPLRHRAATCSQARAGSVRSPCAQTSRCADGDDGGGACCAEASAGGSGVAGSGSRCVSASWRVAVASGWCHRLSCAAACRRHPAPRKLRGKDWLS